MAGEGPFGGGRYTSRMLRRSQTLSTTTSIASALVILLGLLAALQYRWTGELSRAEKERARTSLQRSLEAFGRDLDRELTKLVVVMAAEPGRREEPSLGLRWEFWRSQANWPDLVESLYIASYAEEGEFQLEQISLEGEALSVEWPANLSGLQERFDNFSIRSFGRGEVDRWPLMPEIPALVLPIFPRSGGRPGRRPFDMSALQFMIVELDPSVLEAEMLEDLADRHLPLGHGGVLEFDLAVFDLESGERIYSRGQPIEAGATGDVSVEMLRLLPPDVLGAERERRPPSGDEPREGGDPERRFHRGPGEEGRSGFRGDHRRGPAWTLARLGSQAHWRLVAVHAEGSLDAAVEQVRRRNLAISLGILALLAASLAMLLQSTRRARRLARQQLEFVAGVTHELMTPLAALRSAGQNLADGVITDPSQVARYGSLVDREGRRLTDMVAQVLELAGMWSGQRRLESRPVAVDELLELARQDFANEFEAAEFTVEVDLEEGLPAIRGDAQALRRALGNLFTNALKYASDGAWLGVDAKLRGELVEIRVADRGSGIAEADLPHIFEPFRRGQEMAASSIPGSGLGLSLVRSTIEDHGGEVKVETSPSGTLFRLLLPAAEVEGEGDDR